MRVLFVLGMNLAEFVLNFNKFFVKNISVFAVRCLNYRDHYPPCFSTDMMEPEAEVSSPTSLPTSLRFRCSSMLVPGQWHHLAVVMAKDLKKSCVTSAYFNGKAVGTGKVCC